ncbi:MAG: HlyD family efflux transporter periplasmic adaptor subunit, partial [Patescibacteria group bacterium]
NLQAKNKEDINNNAIISYYNYLNTAVGVLDQINYILAAEKDSSQLAGVSFTLGVKNLQTLNDAKNDYLTVRHLYNQLNERAVDNSYLIDATRSVAALLNQIKILIDDTLTVLNNTIASASFSESALVAQKNSFLGLRSNIIGAQSAAQATLNSLQNIDLTNKQQLDALENAVKIARSQLTLANTGSETASAAFNGAQKNKEQALVGAKAALDNARGQLNIIQTQVADLSLKAPIAGIISQKSVELGSEARAGQILAEVSQSDAVKIVIGISSADVYRIKLGQKAVINDNLEGIVTRIDPAADITTKKVTVEITYDNKDKKLIPETFMDVKLPVS